MYVEGNTKVLVNSPKLSKNHTFVERQERTGFKAFDLVSQAFTPETHGQ